MYAVDGCSDESNSFRAAKALQQCEINRRPRCTFRDLREDQARLRGLEEKLPSDKRVKYAAAFYLHLARGKRSEVAAGGGKGRVRCMSLGQWVQMQLWCRTDAAPLPKKWSPLAAGGG